MTSFVTGLSCVHCSRTFAPEAVAMTCPDCGPDLGILDYEYDIDAVRFAWEASPLEGRPHNHWRYHELLPLRRESIPFDWPVGGTPLIDAGRLARDLGIAGLVLKDDGRGPTASFKDRASSVGVAHALECGAGTVACASTGNAATSLAGHAALAGLPAIIFVPRTAPEPKLAQLLIFGATVIAVQGTYDEAYRLCSSACAEYGWYNRNCAINPVLVEGKKTGGLEIAEQCGRRGALPDWIAVSVGDGCTIAGIWKGLRQMHELGMIETLPRMLGVQATNVAPIAHRLRTGSLPPPGDGTTIADSINVPVPRNACKAMNAVGDSDGTMVTVSDDEILDAMRAVGRQGVFAEPAAAAAVAGVGAAVARGDLGPRDRVLALITGNGLKDTQAALRAGGDLRRVEPTMKALADSLKGDR